MLHQSNFLLETEIKCYFIRTCSKQLGQDEQPAVTVNVINGHKPEMDMTSINNRHRKFTADEKPDNDNEFNIATKSLTEAAVNERRASLKLKNGHDCEEDLNSFSLFTTVKHDLPTDKDVSCGDIVTETGTHISLYSLESARQVLKDGLIDEGKSPEDKLPVVSGCSCLAEESPKVEISMADKIHFCNLGLEIIADHLKVIAMTDKEKNPERQGTSRSDGLAHIKEDDKGLLEETIVLHSSKVEEKHLNPFPWDQNAEEHEIGSISEKCIGEGLFSNKIDSVLKILAEDAERDNKSGLLSAYQKENILEVSARDCARNSGLDLNISNSSNCLAAILQSSCTRMDDCVDSSIETTLPVPFFRDNYTSVESLDCGAGCDRFAASYVNCERERFEIPSHENYAVESSALKGQDSKERTEFPDGWMSETIKDSTLLCAVNNFPPQASPILASEKGKIEVVAESNFASKELSDPSIISCLSSSIGFPADDLVHGHLETGGLKPEKMEVIPGNILGNTRIHQEDSEGQRTVVDEQKEKVNDQKLVSLSQCTNDSIETCELTENLSGNVLGNSGIGREDSEGQIPVVDEQKATVNDQKLLVLSHFKKDSSETYELTENLSGNFSGNPGIRQDDLEGQLAVIDEQKAKFNGQKLLVVSHCTKASNEIHELTQNLSGNVLGNPGIRQDDSEGQIAVVDEQKSTVNGQKPLVLSHCTKASTQTHEFTENLSGNVLGNPGIRQEDLEGKIAVVEEKKATVNGQNLLPLSHCTKDGTESCVLTKNFSGNNLGNPGIRQQDSEGKIAVVDEHEATVKGQKLLVISHCAKAGAETRDLTENLSGNVSGNPGICHEDSEGQIAVPDEPKATGHGHKRLLLSNCTEDSTETCELTENLSVDSKGTTKCDTAEKSGGDAGACVLLNVDGGKNVESQAEKCASGFSEHPVVIRETEAKDNSYNDDQNTLPVTNPIKDGNDTCEMSKRLSIDSMAMNCSPAKDIAENNISTPALMNGDKTKSVRPTLTSGFAENSVCSTDNAQNLHESLVDTFSEVNGNNDAAEMGSYTYSGPIPLSGPISYSGPIPFSGSLSIRSDSSTTSTRSFAFPVLSSEWNSSPVKMVQADPRYFRKKRRWRFLCFCARESSFR